MARGLVGGDHALVDEHLHEGVVPGDLLEHPLPVEVGAGVPDVGQGEAASGSGEEQGGQGGAHALPLRVLPHRLADPRGRQLDPALQGGDQGVLRGRQVQRPDRVDRDPAGQVAGCHPAHAVGDGDEPGAGVQGVLVAAANQPAVTHPYGTQLQGHGTQPASWRAQLSLGDRHDVAWRGESHVADRTRGVNGSSLFSILN